MRLHFGTSNRRFTIFELTAYVSLAAVAFGTLQITSQLANSDNPILEAVGSLLGIAALAIMGALLGVAVGFTLGGRGYVLSGVLVGGLGIPLFLFVATFIVVWSSYR